MLGTDLTEKQHNTDQKTLQPRSNRMGGKLWGLTQFIQQGESEVNSNANAVKEDSLMKTIKRGMGATINP